MIPTIEYKIKNQAIGLLGYAKKTIGKKPFFFIGPSIKTEMFKNMSIYGSYSWDVLSKQNLLFLKLGVKW